MHSGGSIKKQQFIFKIVFFVTINSLKHKYVGKAEP